MKYAGNPVLPQPDETRDFLKGEGEVTVIGYDARQQWFFVDWRHAGQSNFKDSFAAIHSVPLSIINGGLRLHIFVDRASFEVFGNDGRGVQQHCT
ncbi:MAG: GH32 C-terminal domain-containing protein [Chloroflexota bacterium]